MPPFEIGSAPRISPVDTKLPRVTGGDTKLAAATPAATPTVSATPSVETSQALEAGKAPVDTERVALIRQAVEAGTYPLVPAKIADAMIAAGMLLRTAR